MASIQRNVAGSPAPAHALGRRQLLQFLALAPVAVAAGCAGPANQTQPSGTDTRSPLAPPRNATVTLNDGHVMPTLGIGTYSLSPTQAEESVYNALTDGYRLVDTANIYGNEEGVGRGIRRSGVARGDVFVTTKLWTSDFDHAASAIDERLTKLGVDYLDLLLLHHPAAHHLDAYRAMEAAVRAGKIRSIGLSNYQEAEFTEVLGVATITPAVLQNETHPYNQWAQLKQFLKQHGTVLESWFPLGGRGNTQVLFSDSVISDIAKAHGKTSPQVLVRWHLQAGNIAIPGSSNADHIRENISIFDFTLSDDEMRRITELDRRRRFSTF